MKCSGVLRSQTAFIFARSGCLTRWLRSGLAGRSGWIRSDCQRPLKSRLNTSASSLWFHLKSCFCFESNCFWRETGEIKPEALPRDFGRQLQACFGGWFVGSWRTHISSSSLILSLAQLRFRSRHKDRSRRQPACCRRGKSKLHRGWLRGIWIIYSTWCWFNLRKFFD